MSFCSNCGKQLAEGVKFCSECGAKVIESEIQSKEKWYMKVKFINASPALEIF